MLYRSHKNLSLTDGRRQILCQAIGAVMAEGLANAVRILTRAAARLAESFPLPPSDVVHRSRIGFRETDTARSSP